MVLPSSIVAVKRWRRYLPSFSTESAFLQEIVFYEMTMESSSSVLDDEDRRREVVLKLFKYRWLRDRLNLCLSDTRGTRRRASRDALLNILGCNALLSQIGAASDSARLRE